ncbi:hypothetical protein IJS77_04485 [bacterium]|nr:hypothetical protein [bacterium]
MKKILLIAIALMLITPLNANAFSWGDFFRALFGLSSSQTTVTNTSIKEEIETSLKTNMTKTINIDKEVQSAFLSTVSIISGTEETKTIKSKVAEANKKTDDIEKLTALNQIYNDYSTIINNNKVEIVALLALTDDSSKETLVKNINTISDAGQKYVEIGKDNLKLASTTIKKATVDDNRTALLLEINDTTAAITDTAKAATSLSRQIKILAKIAGIKF